jgi:hypothetical protein
VAKRKLPVLNNAPAGPAPESAPPTPDAEEARPPWQWSGFGMVAIFATWLPFSYVAQFTVRSALRRYGLGADTPEAMAAQLAQLDESARTRVMLVMMFPHVLALAAACVAGGVLIGRFGAPAGPREALVAGLMTSLVAMVLSFGAGGWSWAPLATLLITVPFSVIGARLGRRSLVM